MKKLILILLLLTACRSSTPDPKIECPPNSSSMSGYISGVRGSSCGAPLPCNQMSKELRKTVTRCQKWKEKPLLERILLHIIYLQ